MKKYTTYKSSGIDWIGDIPEHWEMIKLKYLGKSLIGLSYQPEDIVEDDTQGILVLRSSNIQNGKLSLSDNVYVKSKVKDNIIVREGDILICSRNGSRSLIGKNITISKELEGNTFGVFMTIFRTPYWNYLSKVFNSMIFTNQSGLFLTSTINQLTQETLNSFVVPFIHNETERTEIVQFLDEKTEIIDKLISTKERKINLLKEQRTSLINQVITKGLDPNVKMKDSGVEWIGEIPEHWKVSKLGFYTTKIGSGSTPRGGSEVYVDSGIPFIRSQNVHFDGLRLDDVSFIDSDTHNSMRGTIVKRNDILLNITGGSIGRCCIVHLENEMNINQHVSIIRTTKDLTPFFLNYILSSDIGQSQVIFNVSGGNREGLTIEGIRNFNIIIPTIPEQIRIVEYLDKITKEINDLVSLEQKKIEVLKEYRQSLISEVITGKINVCNN